MTRATAHGPIVLCGFSQKFPTKQLLRKKILKKNLYRARNAGKLGKTLVLLAYFSQLSQYKN